MSSATPTTDHQAKSGAPASARPARVDVSVVVPMLNEEENVEALYRELAAMIDGESLVYEIIFVDDGSDDRTVARLREAVGDDSRVTIVELARRFGQTAAMAAGFDHVHGDVAPPFFCLPIIAHGETIGLLHLRFDGFEEGGLLRHMREQVLRHRWDLGLICAEQISLAIANVRLRQELEDQSVRDPLTGLWNRRWFLDAAHRELARARDTGRPLSLISLDVDHFKRFNDHHGHDAGDTVLREVGALMRTHFHGDCRPCRLGGEEFVILCVNTPCDAALELAHGFAQVLKDVRIAYDGQMLPPITVSGGISSHPGHADSVLRLLKIADTALYAAKEAGRDRILIAEAVTGSSPGHSTKQTEAERNRPPPPQRAQGAKC